jgi:NADPH:quinone reductase-like Zn-dependent oxidoreductase
MFPCWIAGRIEWEYAPQLGGSLDGMISDFVVLNQDALVRIADHLSCEEAATLPCTAVIAWNALTGARRLQAGDKILTIGSGSMSLFALQFAKAFGARVIATTSSDEKAARLKAVRADDVINYRKNANWHVVAREMTRGRGVDQVIETAGGTLEQSISQRVSGDRSFLLVDFPVATPKSTPMFFNSVASTRVNFAGNRDQFMAMNCAHHGVT